MTPPHRGASVVPCVFAFAAAVVALALGAAPAAHAVTFVVNTNANTDDGACTATVTGCTLIEAIDDANATVAADEIASAPR